MSYVIQNFNFGRKAIIFTPRLRFQVICKSLKFFFFFLKLSFFFWSHGQPYYARSSHYGSFYNHLFSKQLSKVLRTLNLKLLGNYVSNYTKSVAFHALRYLDSSLTTSEYPLESGISHRTCLLHNTNYLSIKVANNKINKKFYENVFFYFALYLTQMWYPHSSFIKFYSNFFLVTYNTQLLRFYNGYFFKIYNF